MSRLQSWMWALTLSVLGVGFAAVLQIRLAPLIDPLQVGILDRMGAAIVAAVSLGAVLGFTGRLSLGHAGFVSLGAYAAGAASYYGHFLVFGNLQREGGFAGPSAGLFLASLLVGGIASAVAGLAVGWAALRGRGQVLALATLGFAEILRALLERSSDVLVDSATVRTSSISTLLTSLGGTIGFTGVPMMTGPFWAWSSVVAVWLVALQLKRAPQIRSRLADGGEISPRMRLGVFVVGMFFAGVAGGLMAHEVGQPHAPSTFGPQLSLWLLAAVLLGGVGSVSGTSAAAAGMVLLAALAPALDARCVLLWGPVLAGFALWRPEGLLGSRELWDLPPLSWLKGSEAPPSGS